MKSWNEPLVETMPFDRRVVGSNPALAATWWPWASPSLAVACSASACKLRHSVNCCGRELFWVIADLKRRYRNMIRNEWMNESHACEEKLTLKLTRNESFICIVVVAQLMFSMTAEAYISIATLVHQLAECFQATKSSPDGASFQLTIASGYG